ncbi:DEAH-box RNA helicase prp16 [Chytriomyces hyalinus]|nr:DEAH-box RNA helicase prp16 [Chytriomyces hyalinus]
MQQPEPDPTQADDGGAASIEKDRLLPIANVSRLMKRALPENAKIAKDAKDCLQECVSEFISFVTSEASDRCTLEKRKTVSGDDIIFALQSLGFDNYSETLKIYLAKYKEASRSAGAPLSREEQIAMQGALNAASLNAHALEQTQSEQLQRDAADNDSNE